LEAVNTILSSIGERPVASLEDSTRLDVVHAIKALTETSKLVQIRGWWYNTEEEVSISPTIDDEIIIPGNVRKIDLTDKNTTKKYVFRGSKLYDLETRSYDVFTESVEVDWIIELPFDELPETARLYIMLRAGVVFQQRALGSVTLFQFTEEDAAKAWALLLEEELEQIDKTLLQTDGIYRSIVAHWR
jgi:hypothetical protein